MRVPTALRSLDDRVLGRRHQRADDEPYPEGHEHTRVEQHADDRTRGDGPRRATRIVLQVSAAVLLGLALVLGLGVLFLLAPTNDSNSLVSGVRDLSDAVAGPFLDVFTADDARTERTVNLLFALGVYLVGAAVLNRLAQRLAPLR